MGRGGLYYRKRFSQSRRKARPQAATPPPLPDTQFNDVSLQEIASSDVLQMSDSTTDGFLADLSQKRKRVRFWPAVLAAVLLFALAMILANVPHFLVAVLVVPLSYLAFLVFQLDETRCKTVLLYDLTPEVLQALEAADGWFNALRATQVWNLVAQGEVGNRKYSAGASSREGTRVPEQGAAEANQIKRGGMGLLRAITELPG